MSSVAMGPMLRAFLRVRWIVFRRGIVPRRGENALASVGRIARLLPLVFPIAAVAVGVAGGLAFGLGGGFWLGRHPAQAQRQTVLLIMFPFIALAWALGEPLFMEMASLEKDRTADSTLVRLMPVPERLLYLVRLVRQLLSAPVLLIMPFTVLLPAGLLAAGAFRGAAYAAGAGALFLVTLVAGGALLEDGWELVFRGRGRGDSLKLVLMGAIMIPALAAMQLFMNFIHWLAVHSEGATVQQSRQIAERVHRVLRLLTLQPAGFYGRGIAAAIGGNQSGAMAWLVPAAAAALVCALASVGSHRRLMRSVPAGAARGGPAVALGLLGHLPGLSAAASAVAVVQAREIVRSTRGRVLLFGPLILSIAFAPMFQTLGLIPFPPEVPSFVPRLLSSPAFLIFFCVVAGYANVNPIHANWFGVSRGGLALESLLPLDSADLVLGKTVGTGACYAASMAVGLIPLAFLIPEPAAVWAGVGFWMMGLYPLLSPVCVLVSALFPFPGDLGEVSGAGNNPLGMMGLITTMAALAVPEGVIALVTLGWMNRPWLFAFASLVFALGGAVAGLMLLRKVAPIVDRRREEIFLAAGEG